MKRKMDDAQAAEAEATARTIDEMEVVTPAPQTLTSTVGVTPAEAMQVIPQSTATPVVAPLEKLAPDDDVLPRTPPQAHHHISESKRTWLDAYGFPRVAPDDPALQVFVSEHRSY
jgi:hypothetical protein